MARMVWNWVRVRMVAEGDGLSILSICQRLGQRDNRLMGEVGIDELSAFGW